jgi:hypothetical protein
MPSPILAFRAPQYFLDALKAAAKKNKRTISCEVNARAESRRQRVALTAAST